MTSLAERYAARDIGQTLNLLRCGAWAQEEIDKLMGQLAEHVTEHGGTAKGSVTIKLDFDVDRETVNAKANVTVARPKPPARKALAYLTDGGSLTARDPNQHEMFREDAVEGRVVLDAD